MTQTKDMVAMARELIEVAGSEWLHEQRLNASRSQARAEAAEVANSRRARLRVMVARAAQIHEIDAQIDLLSTLPKTESEQVTPLLKRLRQIRDRLVCEKSGSARRG